MTASHDGGSQRGWALILAAVIIGWVTTARVGAEDRNYVMPDGHRIKLIRSTSEYGVTLHHGTEKGTCAKRLAEAKAGLLEDFKDAPLANVKLLRVQEMTPERFRSVLQDPAVTEVRPVYRFEGSDSPVVATGTVVAKVRKGLSAEERDALWELYNLADATPLNGQPDVYVLTAVGDDDADVAMAEKLAGDRRVQWANPNFRRQTVQHQVIPSDPFYNRQWHLNNTGQLGGVVDADIDVPEAWAISTGTDVLFGMFDEACDVDHEDLRGNYVGFGQDATLTEGAEGYDDPRPKQPGERHGTSVMGLAVAAGNTLGGRGVAYEAKFTASRGLTILISDAQVARVYSFARESNVDVHINSWGFFPGTPDPPVIVDAIELAFREGRNRGDLDGDGVDDPLGMVVIFASGNDGRLLTSGFELSMLPQVIGIGASNDRDVLSGYSNFGTGLDVVAPSNDDPLPRARILTTDNTDGPEAIDLGYNVGGFYFGIDTIREADTEGKYTQFFGGTSAACPIAAGVAGLILAVNPLLTATDVRLILEHTADRIDPDNAGYDETTSRSLRYGYGRINAGGGDSGSGAVQSAQDTLTNGGFTWPDRPADIRIEGVFLRWRQNFGTSEFLAVVSDTAIEFVPEDGVCYDTGQQNCTADLGSLPAGVQVLGVGCALSCDAAVTATCELGAEQCTPFTPPIAGERKFFAIYARNALGRYSFGVSANSNGDVLDGGTIASEGGGSGGATPPPPGPAVTINVSPLQGVSPLTVNFSGNAVSTNPVDETRASWDFDADDANPIDANTRTTTHTYLVPQGDTRTFVARLTMYDLDGNAGFAEVGIRVQGPAEDDNSGPIGSGDVEITFALPNNPGAFVDEGPSPFSIVASVDAEQLSGTLQSVVWDLGDGTRSTGLSVPYTYINRSDADLRFPVTVTVTRLTTGGVTITSTGTRFITVNPGLAVIDPGDPDLPGTHPSGAGGAATPCSPIGMIPLVAMMFGLSYLRRKG